MILQLGGASLSLYLRDSLVEGGFESLPVTAQLLHMFTRVLLNAERTRSPRELYSICAETKCLNEFLIIRRNST